MSRFSEALQEISERLSLPHPVRARVLLEIAGDLEDLFQIHVERGASEEEAARESLAHIDLSDEALRELVRVHGGWVRRLLDSVGERAGSGWERLLLGALVATAVALSGAVVQTVPMSWAAGPWLIPVVCASGVALGIGVWKVWVLSVRGDHRPRVLRRGLSAVLGLSLLQMFLAFAGLWVSAIGTLRAIGVEPTRAGPLTMHWLQGVLALLVMSLSLALVGGLVWFFLLGKVTSIEHDEAEALLAG